MFPALSYCKRPKLSINKHARSLYWLEIRQKIQNIKPFFYTEIFYCGATQDWKGFTMIYHPTESDDYMWYLILREKRKTVEKHPNTKFLHIFYGRNKKLVFAWKN